MRSGPIRAKAALALAAVYLLALGLLGGILIERVRFDRSRTAVLERYDEAVREWQAERMAIELGQVRARADVSQPERREERRAQAPASVPRTISRALRWVLWL
jgi:hypothetical protein